MMPADYNNSLRVPRSRSRAPARNPSTSHDNHSHNHSNHIYSSGSNAGSSYRLTSTTAGSTHGHSLRPAYSRYSLNEQFAATRREYDFDDDGSSIFDRQTLASEVVNEEEEGEGEGEAEGDEDREGAPLPPSSLSPPGDLYGALGLPRRGDLVPAQIRRAYHRQFLLFYPDSYPEHVQPFARRHFDRAQLAFETLIDPVRRADYEHHLTGSEEEDEGAQPEALSYRLALQDAILQDAADTTTASDLVVRPNVSRPASRSSALDFALRHSLSYRLPWLARYAKYVRPDLDGPLLILSGGICGIADDAVLPSSHQRPIGPTAGTSRRHDAQNRSRLLPTASLTLRQEFPHRQLNEVLELEYDVLPSQSLTSRYTIPVSLPATPFPTILECTTTSGPLAKPSPRLILGAHHPVLSGNGFLRIDSGSGGSLLPQPGTCRSFSEFAELVRPGTLLAKLPPSVELGFTTAPHERQLASLMRHPIREQSAVRALDAEPIQSNAGIWTVATSASPISVAGYLRYTRDISPLPRRSHRQEVELSANPILGSYLALRNLWPAGRLSKAGLELAFGSRSVCLSIYWSRLNQRMSLPLLICPMTGTSRRAGWLAVLSFASVAAVQFWKTRRHRRRRDVELAKSSRDLVACHRLEADRVSALLAAPIEAQQKRQQSVGGLVILSAKYGVQDEHGSWGGEEVADVTVAVAALIDKDGLLNIPEGVRKGYLPGFWDPAPGQDKVLHVRYSWKGKVAVAESTGEEELILPL
ncbi:hypothetical protein B0I35DRAFT_477841 [Stachybotrys elegans]|uniref:J domain-containing protein n=1 Tax=Stachybotrys elegans TaxID=80388 RepID=A0A8K0SV96_9HYPO|nr:hypothetical protein B0I35DRAFT_477841 [Stachybotrys elegans]